MKIAIIGATGNVGSRLVAEALRRGHHVTAVARGTAGRLPADTRLALVDADAHDTAALAAAIEGHDVAISSVAFRMVAGPALIAAVRRSGVKRYLVVGGAGSLEVAPGQLLVDTQQFPAAYKEEATQGKQFLDALRDTNDLDWTMLSPSALFVPGERTGRFRIGGNTLLVGADGQSTVSYEDFAVAMFDEIERPAHLRQRFTVGY